MMSQQMIYATVLAAALLATPAIATYPSLSVAEAIAHDRAGGCSWHHDTG